MIYVIVRFYDFFADKEGAYNHLCKNKEVSNTYAEKEKALAICDAESWAHEKAETLLWYEHYDKMEIPKEHIGNLFEVREMESEESQSYRVIFRSIETIPQDSKLRVVNFYYEPFRKT